MKSITLVLPLLLFLSGCDTTENQLKRNKSKVNLVDTVITTNQSDSISLLVEVNENKLNSGDNSDLIDKIIIQFLAGIVSLGVAILAFLYANKRNGEKEKEEEKERELNLLRLIAIEIKRNINFVAQISAYSFVYINPTFSLSLYFKDELTDNDLRSVKDIDLLEKLISKYFEFDHIQNRLDRINKLWNLQKNYSKGNTTRKTIDTTIKKEFGGLCELAAGNVSGAIKVYNYLILYLHNNNHSKELQKLDKDYAENLHQRYKTDEVVKQEASKQNINLDNLPEF